MVRFLTWLFHALPLGVVLFFGRAMGRLVFDVLRIRRSIVLDNLARALPEISDSERLRIARRTYLNLGMMVCEFVRSPRMTPQEVREVVDLDGWEVLQAHVRAGRGVVIVTAHFGNWELAATATAIVGLPLTIITRKLARLKINDYWIEARDRAGLRVLPSRDSLRDILRVVRSGEVLGIVIDQNMIPPKGIFVPFFGRPASTISLPAVLAERTGVPIMTGFMVRQPRGRHRLVLRDYEYERVSEDRTENIRHNTARLNEILEEWIRAHPDHWLWLHRRWKTQPPDDGLTAPPPSATTPTCNAESSTG